MVVYDNAVHKDYAKKWGGTEHPGSVSGFGGLAYESPWQLDKKYYGTANSASVQYQKAAGQILQGAESADAAMLNAYRDVYRARLGGAAAGQQQFVQQQGAEMDGMGLSPDLVRRMIASRKAQQSQMLGAQQGELMGEYGMQRAGLLQQTGNSLASLLVDETKFGKGYGLSRKGGGAGGASFLGPLIGQGISSIGNFASSAASSSGIE